MKHVLQLNFRNKHCRPNVLLWFWPANPDCAVVLYLDFDSLKLIPSLNYFCVCYGVSYTVCSATFTKDGWNCKYPDSIQTARKAGYNGSCLYSYHSKGKRITSSLKLAWATWWVPDLNVLYSEALSQNKQAPEEIVNETLAHSFIQLQLTTQL